MTGGPDLGHRALFALTMISPGRYGRLLISFIPRLLSIFFVWWPLLSSPCLIFWVLTHWSARLMLHWRPATNVCPLEFQMTSRDVESALKVVQADSLVGIFGNAEEVNLLVSTTMCENGLQLHTAEAARSYS